MEHTYHHMIMNHDYCIQIRVNINYIRLPTIIDIPGCVTFFVVTYIIISCKLFNPEKTTADTNYHFCLP